MNIRKVDMCQVLVAFFVLFLLYSLVMAPRKEDYILDVKKLTTPQLREGRPYAKLGAILLATINDRSGNKSGRFTFINGGPGGSRGANKTLLENYLNSNEYQNAVIDEDVENTATVTMDAVDKGLPIKYLTPTGIYILFYGLG